MTATRRRILFVAAHLLHGVPNSGGDVLFERIARQIAADHPEWHLGLAAPAYAEEIFGDAFESFIPIDAHRTADDRTVSTNGFLIAAAWCRRVRPATRASAAWRPDIIHSTGDFFPDVLVGRHVGAACGAGWTGVIHHINPPPLQRRNALVRATASYLFQRWSFRALRTDCDRISLLNGATREQLVRLGFDRNRLRIVGAGVMLQRLPLRLPPPESRRVLWVHRLEPTKGIADLPQIAAHLPAGAHLDVVGLGSPAVIAWLQARLRALGAADRTTLHGYVSDHELASLYGNARVFISCSYEEGWGISLCEALASGIECLAYDLPSHREIFGDAVRTVPTGNVQAFSAALNALLATPDPPTARERRRARVAGYTIEAAARRQAAVFDEMLRETCGPDPRSSMRRPRNICCDEPATASARRMARTRPAVDAGVRRAPRRPGPA